jgi:Transposase
MREIPNEPAAIRKTIQRLGKGRELRCCYEAGPCGYVLHRQLAGMGVDCQVVAPSLIPQKPGDRVKTDRRDAAKLARLLRAGELTPIGVPTEDQEAVRDLVRAREAARRARTDARHRLTKFLLRHGHRYHASNWTGQFWKWVNGVVFVHAELTKVLQHYTDMVLHLDRQIEDLDAHIETVAAREPFRGMVAPPELPARHQHARRDGDPLRSLRLASIRHGKPVHGLPRRGAQRTLEWAEATTRRHHQDRQRTRSPHPGRGGLGLPPLPEGDVTPTEDAEPAAARHRRRVSQGEPAAHPALPSTRGQRQTITGRDDRDRSRTRRVRLGHRPRRLRLIVCSTPPEPIPRTVSSKPAEDRRPRSRLRHGRSILDVFLRQDPASESALSERGSSRRFTCHAALLVEQPAHPRVTNRRHVCFERGLRSSPNAPPGGRSRKRRPPT